MMTDISNAGTAQRAPWGDLVVPSDSLLLRRCAVVAGMGCAALFVAVGLGYELQLYADGSMFSYSVAVQDAWAFHWHNISGRLFVYLITELPAELYVNLTNDAQGGIAVYGFLFFVVQLLSLVATWAADRSAGRTIFTYACASTACLCPLVFGFPTEMWVAHAMFWPTLAVCHYARGGIVGAALVLAMLLALILTHEAALILATVIVATLLLRGTGHAKLLRGAATLLAAISIWGLVKLTLPPDAYDGPMMRRAAFEVFELKILTGHIFLLLLVALTSYGIICLALRRKGAAQPHIWAGLLVAVALAAYWSWFDGALHADERYPMRTVLLIGTAALGALAAAHALAADGCLRLRPRFLPYLLAILANDATARVLTGAILVVLLVHAVETAKFVRAWADYRAAISRLAMSAASDPALGDARFVSSDRIGAELNRVSWDSTTPFLSVLVAPRFAPARLVVDPKARYFWLSCQTATANYQADRAIPAQSRWLVRRHACLHR